eukprot:TRINITY_DN1560_c0_g1_i2.p1 TRINITY_DN1560_c0_g1~~TRINITY_DN1560_c0_g1_i2.p1  ORF type:complete len:120 (-),score=27.42 TRINITY_DN1560_c0_g1_i2:29-388(-)
MSHVPHAQYQQGPSCLSRGLMGFALGGMVGGAFGLLLGGYACLRAGLRGSELLKQAGKSALQSGGAFGGFMCIGSVIRCSEPLSLPSSSSTTPSRTRDMQWQNNTIINSNKNITTKSTC